MNETNHDPKYVNQSAWDMAVACKKEKLMNRSKLTPEQAINILNRMAPGNGMICFCDAIADVIRDLVKQAESNVKTTEEWLDRVDSAIEKAKQT